MLQNQFPVRRWAQRLAFPVLSGLLLLASQAASAQTTSLAGDAAARQAKRKIIAQKIREAETKDSLRTGGKFEPGTVQQFNIANMQGKPEDVTVTITRVKAPTPPGQATPSGKAVYTYVEHMPALPAGSGIAPIVKQIQDNLVYPAGPRQEGRVFASFVVNADGSVSDAKIARGLSPAYDEAVLAAIQKLPRFVPGTQAGRLVAVSFMVPVTFKAQ